MSFLFGHLYDSPCKFTHDQAMFRKKGGDAGIVPESRPRTLDNNIAEPSVGRDVDREQEPRSFPADVSLQHLPNTKASYKRSHDLPALAQEHDKAPVVRIQVIPLESGVDPILHRRIDKQFHLFKQSVVPPTSLIVHPLVCRYHQRHHCLRTNIQKRGSSKHSKQLKVQARATGTTSR
jgi:hypothetical protein